MQSVYDATEALKPILDPLRAELAKAKTKKQAQKAVDKWVKANAGNPALIAMIFGPAIQAELAGQLMVDVHVTEDVKLSRNFGDIHKFAYPADAAAFLDLPWEEAIELYQSMESRGLIPRDREFARLIEEYAARGGEASELFLEQIRTKSYNLIEKALEEGTDFSSFAGEIDDFTNRLGVGTSDPNYLQTVFRTNISTAYGAGRARALEEVAEQIPYWIYRTAGDSVVRPEHAVLEGKIFRHGNPKTDVLKPPNGFNCRCAAIAHELEEGDRVTTTIPEKAELPPEFAANPSTLVRRAIR